MKGRYINYFLMIMLLIHCSGCIRSEQHLRCNREKNLKKDREILYSNPIEEDVALTLNEIVNIALNRNWDIKIKELECRIQQEATTGAKLNMLPELLTSGEINTRYNSPGSSSESLDPAIPPSPPSISSDKHTKVWNTTLTWSLLDFGISYFRARQEANKMVINQLEMERLKQNIVLDISKYYWDMVAAKEAIEKTLFFLERVEMIEGVFARAADSRLVSLTRVMETQDHIYRRRLKLKSYQREYTHAKTELQRLMGLPPGSNFEIAYDATRPVFVVEDIKVLEDTALHHRPELFSYDIEEKVTIDEVRIAVLGYIPGISLFSAYDYNENRFLLNNYWNTIGVRAAWDLFSIPAGRSKERLARHQRNLAKRNRLALSLAALSQVHLSYLTYLDDFEAYSLTQQTESLKQEMLNSAEIKKTVGKFDIADLIDFEANFLDAEIMSWRNYANLQFSMEQLNNAIGLPLYYGNKPEDIVNRDDDDDGKNSEDEKVEEDEEIDFAA